MYTQGCGRSPEIFAVESKAWNSKSKIVLDSLAWSDWRDFTVSSTNCTVFYLLPFSFGELGSKLY